MKRKKTKSVSVLYLISAGILLCGLISAVVIYRQAMSDQSGSEYDIEGGFLYPGGGTYSKKYVHDLQLYGGKSAVLADQFMRWFNGLWQGASLAYTVVVITVVLSLVLFVIARHMQIHHRADQ